MAGFEVIIYGRIWVIAKATDWTNGGGSDEVFRTYSAGVRVTCGSLSYSHFELDYLCDETADSFCYFQIPIGGKNAKGRQNANSCNENLKLALVVWGQRTGHDLSY
jgi:hypothetical protein